MNTKPAHQINPRHAITWFGDISSENAQDVLKKVLEFKPGEDGEMPTLLLSSMGGGTMSAAVGFHELITTSHTSLIVIGVGMINGPASIILAAGTKKLITPHCTWELPPQKTCAFLKKEATVDEMWAAIRSLRKEAHVIGSILAKKSSKKLSHKEAVEFALKGQVLLPRRMLEYGIADEIVESSEAVLSTISFHP